MCWAGCSGGPDISRNSLSLAEASSLSPIDKWGGKHVADEPVSLQRLSTSLSPLHAVLLQRNVLLPLIGFKIVFTV